MTHDELLERLHIEQGCPVGDALLAVVELAKPDDSDEVYPENKVWKSIIIQAIEKELK